MTAPTPPAVSEAMREAVARDHVLIKRGLYYRPNSMGYTGVLDEAGRYTEAEAKAQADHCDGVTARLASEAPRFSDACWTETIVRTHQFDLAGANYEIERQASEIARLTGERDAMERGKFAALGLQQGGSLIIRQLENQIAKLKAERKLCDKRIRGQRANLRQLWKMIDGWRGSEWRASLYRFAQDRGRKLRAAEAALSRLQADRDAEVGKLRTALEFYADDEGWSGHSDEPRRLQFESRGRDGHGFDVARAALAETPDV